MNSHVVAELNVPHSDEVMARTYGFFQAIGWVTRPHTTEPASVYVHPLERGVGPVVAYWHTANPKKIDRFAWHDEADPSEFSKGLWHPVLQETTELVLIVPDEATVQEVHERGGEILAAHTHVPLREHAGALEFRFTDPFNNALRITANPGYEI